MSSLIISRIRGFRPDKDRLLCDNELPGTRGPKIPTARTIRSFSPFAKRRIGRVAATFFCLPKRSAIGAAAAALLSANNLIKKLFLPLLFIAFDAHATTWYLDNTATGANNGTSWANAWTSLAVINSVQPGDTVYISGGPSVGLG